MCIRFFLPCCHRNRVGNHENACRVGPDCGCGSEIQTSAEIESRQEASTATETRGQSKWKVVMYIIPNSFTGRQRTRPERCLRLIRLLVLPSHTKSTTERGATILKMLRVIAECTPYPTTCPLRSHQRCGVNLAPFGLSFTREPIGKDSRVSAVICSGVCNCVTSGEVATSGAVCVGGLRYLPPSPFRFRP